jgi:2-polyprenyl-3-methyl-5-hydroxy-6-metoxy-1,4-benzoquinol methylase
MIKKDDIRNANDVTRQAWDENAEFWDEKMGEGNDFVNILLWPALLRLLEPRPTQRILDIATGNGLTARRLAALGVEVVAFDFSSELIKIAQARTPPEHHIAYHTLDATDELAMLTTLGRSENSDTSGAFDSAGTSTDSTTSSSFDSALCNMALFDMADIQPLFHVLPKLIKPGGRFVFSITHPAFNNSSCVHVGEETDVDGQIKTVYSVKVTRYITPSQAQGVAMRDQPRPQLYFDRPLQYYLNLGFQNGFVLDGFEERAFPPDHPQVNPLAWGGSFSEIPPVLVARLRLPR